MKPVYVIVAAMSAVLGFGLAAAAAMPQKGFAPVASYVGKTSVYCGATGCQPVTHVKHCSLNPPKRNPVTGQIVAQKSCNF